MLLPCTIGEHLSVCLNIMDRHTTVPMRHAQAILPLEEERGDVVKRWICALEAKANERAVALEGLLGLSHPDQVLTVPQVRLHMEDGRAGAT